MVNEHLLSGLMRKRAELAGKLEHHQAVVRQLFIDLDNVDATIRMFDPDIELNEIRPKPLPPRHAAYKGEVAFGEKTATIVGLTTDEIGLRVPLYIIQV